MSDKNKTERRMRDPIAMTREELKQARELADYYDLYEIISEEYFEYYYALRQGWITPDQFTIETGRKAPTAK